MSAMILSLTCQVAFGQKPDNKTPSKPGTIITEGDLAALKYASEDKLKSGNYQITTVEEILSGSNTKPDEVKTTIYQSMPPDKMRVTEETKTSDGGVSKTGFMMIDKNRYRIDADGKWLRDPRAGYGSGVGSGSGRKTIPQTYKFIGKSVLEGKPILIYEVSGKHSTYFNKQFLEADEQTRYWFSPDGKLLQSEGVNVFSDLNVRVKKLVKNKFNAKLYIQAPSVEK
ncbi:MAG: hypothetical protein ACR2L1_01405 [Pyrinomonadaceae bacterium]